MTQDTNALLMALMSSQDEGGLSPESALTHLSDNPQAKLIAQLLKQRDSDEAEAADEDDADINRLVTM